MTLASWLLAAALAFAPPSKLPQWPGHLETEADIVERYSGFVADIEAAVEGRKDARSAAALALAWSIGESGLTHDAMVGPCYREGAYRKRCDSGLAAGPFQMHAFTDRATGERYTVSDIFRRRADVTRIAVRQMAASWTMCRHLPREDRLSGFGIGHCVEGNRSVRARFKLWQAIAAWRPDESEKP